jgi:hypothetical protein
VAGSDLIERRPGRFAGPGRVYLFLQPGDVVAGQLPGLGPVPEVLLLAFRAAQQQPLAGRDPDEPRTRLAPPRIEASRSLQNGQERRRHQVRDVGGLAAPASRVRHYPVTVPPVEHLKRRRVGLQPGQKHGVGIVRHAYY